MVGNEGFTEFSVDGGQDDLAVAEGLLDVGVVPTALGCFVLLMVGSLRFFGTGGFAESLSVAPWITVSGTGLEEVEGTTEASSSWAAISGGKV